MTNHGAWFKSSFSNGQANCVEARFRGDGGIDIRDTKDNGVGPILSYTPAEWDAFLGGVRNGEFDRQ
jgi:hypothetical protein